MPKTIIRYPTTLVLLSVPPEGPEFDSILAAGQVGQVQQVVAIRFASLLALSLLPYCLIRLAYIICSRLRVPVEA